MVEFLSKFHGRGIKIARVNYIRVAKPLIFLQYLTCCCSLSDVIVSYRFICVEGASTSP